MPDDNTSDTSTTETGAAQTGDQSGSQGNPEYPEGLGDAGKRAIDRMKAERDEANRNLATLRADFDAFKAAHSTPAATAGNTESTEKPKDQERSAQDVENDILAKFQAQALRSTVRESAKGKLADPEDALNLVDFSDITPNQFGEFPVTSIVAKIDQLIKDKPYLGANKNAFNGSADGGPRGESTAKSQLSRDALKTMSPAEINKARSEGRLDDIMAGK